MDSILSIEPGVSSLSFDKIQKQFVSCFADAGVFARDSASGTFFEIEKIRKGKQDWLAVAAGVSESLAKKCFPNSAGRQQRAELPVNIMGGGQLSFAFILRSIGSAELNETNAEFVTTFAPRRGIPFIQLQNSFFRLSDLPVNNSRLDHLRWELDTANAFQQPHESWLHPWKDALSFNPAHPPSHLHINQMPFDNYKTIRDASVHSPAELRLAVGVPNPLALILSVAAWKRISHKPM